MPHVEYNRWPRNVVKFIYIYLNVLQIPILSVKRESYSDVDSFANYKLIFLNS